MRIRDVITVWKRSVVVAERGGMHGLRSRLTFCLNACVVGSALRPFLSSTGDPNLDLALAERPEIVGAVVWPYVCSSWSPKRRLTHLAQHFRIARSLGPTFAFPIEETRTLLDLSDLIQNLSVVLDQAKWFMREGPLVINLFIAEVRIFSLAFSFADQDGRYVVYVGAIQGGRTIGILDDYKELTKAFQGLRPRDLLIELLRMLCRHFGVHEILAVADASRQHRSAYFGADKASSLALNYDSIWEDRGGVRYDADFFVLPVLAPAKSIEEIPSKRRAMYRRRFELLEALERRLRATLTKSSDAGDSECPTPPNLAIAVRS